jgi:glucose-fructose oxidoreductase
VVGLGYISQVAVLPAFKHAQENCRLAALVSDDPVKLRRLGRKHGVRDLYSYEQYDDCLRSGKIDAVYIALPNSMHCEYTVEAAESGIHVLCEKPMAVTSEECSQMIEAAGANDIRLMIAYRLHFEGANLSAVELAQSGKLGDLRTFNSVFAMSVKEGNIRLDAQLGGGTLFDIGIYCINAARYLFRSEPYEVFAFSASGRDPRFLEVDEMTSAVLRFPDDRLATFTSSFGASDVSMYQLVGTKGSVCLDPAYEFVEDLHQQVTLRERTKKKTFHKRDQFAPELIYFSDCVRKAISPEPSGEEGLADVRIIEALYESARSGQPVRLEPFQRRKRPSRDQEMKRAPVRKQELVRAEEPTRPVGV